MARGKRLRTWGKTRKGALAIDVYSEGRAVFLYDEAHAGRIVTSGAFREALGGARASHRALQELVKEGLLVVYEQPGDAGVSLEVMVGPPLTEKERGKLRWLAPQHSFLRLPSGRLRVDSPDTLPGHTDETEEVPGRAEVPPGDYLLTLHRLDVDAASRRLGAEIDGPMEIVTLTPLGSTDRRPDGPPILLYEGSADTSWPGKYTVEGRRFRGLVLFNGADSQILLNLDRAAARQLQLRAGMGLRLRVAAVPLEVEAWVVSDERLTNVFAMPPATLKIVRVFAAVPERTKKKEFPHDPAAGEWVRAADWYGAFRVKLPEAARDTEILRFIRIGRGTPIPHTLQMEWLPAEVDVVDRPALPAAYLREVGLA